MKLFVDEMPEWSGACIFAEDYDSSWFEIHYTCSLTNKDCDLNNDSCHMLRELKIKVIS